ncbi:follistatin-A-like isoform X2 [Amphibalanus amphitrite]|uniref:follistatin-A-like isoform X2 n=1 Tax=Amphibalanus amphitrite TaxID=1232801 RepID=UPI001C922C00|nr:follistatin-A-like isoform X2 [Amphibalanus amphitrite]
MERCRRPCRLSLLLLPPLWCGLMTGVQAGTCWQADKRVGRCTSLLEMGISREACCAKGPQNTAWSDDEYDNDGRLFFQRTLNGGVPCSPCKASCSDVKCDRGEKCRRRNGVPRCVCAPKCRVRRVGRGPVCGNDGRTYRNYCKLLRRQCRKKSSLLMAYKGACQTSCKSVKCARKNEQCVLDQNRIPHCAPCLRRCSDRASSPICGVNGVTYKNRCQARRAACLNGSAIPIAYRGPCRPGLTCSRLRCKQGQRCLLSPKTRTPRCVNCQLRCRRRGRGKQIKVCGSNYVTYRSWCHLMKDSCATGLVIDVLHHGKCYSRRFEAGAGDNNTTAPFSSISFLHN